MVIKLSSHQSSIFCFSVPLFFLSFCLCLQILFKSWSDSDLTLTLLLQILETLTFQWLSCSARMERRLSPGRISQKGLIRYCGLLRDRHMIHLSIFLNVRYLKARPLQFDYCSLITVFSTNCCVMRPRLQGLVICVKPSLFRQERTWTNGSVSM